jgi:hypothetical protein
MHVESLTSEGECNAQGNNDECHVRDDSRMWSMLLALFMSVANCDDESSLNSCWLQLIESLEVENSGIGSSGHSL